MGASFRLLIERLNQMDDEMRDMKSRCPDDVVIPFQDGQHLVAPGEIIAVPAREKAIGQACPNRYGKEWTGMGRIGS